MLSMDQRFERLEEKIKTYLPASDTKRLRDAYECATNQHNGQLRKDGVSLLSAIPLAVADLVADLGLGYRVGHGGAPARLRGGYGHLP